MKAIIVYEDGLQRKTSMSRVEALIRTGRVKVRKIEKKVRTMVYYVAELRPCFVRDMLKDWT